MDNISVLQESEGAGVCLLLAKRETLMIELGFMISKFMGREDALIDTQALTRFLADGVPVGSSGNDIGMILWRA